MSDQSEKDGDEKAYLHLSNDTGVLFIGMSDHPWLRPRG